MVTNKPHPQGLPAPEAGLAPSLPSCSTCRPSATGARSWARAQPLFAFTWVALTRNPSLQHTLHHLKVRSKGLTPCSPSLEPPGPRVCSCCDSGGADAQRLLGSPGERLAQPGCRTAGVQATNHSLGNKRYWTGEEKKKTSNPNKSTAGVKLHLELLSGCQNNLLFKILQEMLFGGICNYCQYLCHLRVFLYITGVCMYIFVFLPYARTVKGVLLKFCF